MAGRRKTDREKEVETIGLLSDMGFHLIPLHHPTKLGCSCGVRSCPSTGKHPLQQGWQNKAILNKSTAQKALRGKNVGVLTGTEIEEGCKLFVLDVDNHHEGGVSLAKLEEENEKLPNTFTVKTGRGFHYYFKAGIQPLPNSVGLVGDGIDVRGDGGYVVAPPSKHENGKAYTVLAGTPKNIAWAPKWLVEAINSNKRRKRRDKVTVKVTLGGRNEHLTSIAGMMRKNGMSEKAMYEALMVENDIQCDPPLKEAEVRSIAHSVAKYPAEESDWSELMSLNSQGHIRNSEANCALILSKSDIFKGCLEYDEFTGEGTWTRQPDSRFALRVLGPRVDMERDFVDIQHILDKEFKVTFKRNVITSALLAVLKQNSYDSLKDHVMALKRTGRKSKLDHWLSTYLGARKCHYTNIVGRRFLIGMVARALRPGCKMDNMLILESKSQGLGKSTAAMILGGPFFDAGPIAPKDKDFLMRLRQAWVFEIGELGGFNKTKIEAMKHFITDRTDTYREPYGRVGITVPRRTVFIGTTNETNYLVDKENRRFWPIKVGRMRLDQLREDRESILAEARDAFLAGERWWPTLKEQKKYFARHQNKRSAILDDPWFEALEHQLEAYKSKQVFFIPNEAVWRIVQVDPDRRSGYNGQRLARCMEMHGWHRSKSAQGRGYIYSHSFGFGDELVSEMSEATPIAIPGGNPEDGEEE